jgi:hypothetical protein
MFVLEVALAMLFSLDGSVDPTRVVRRNLDAINQKVDGCQQIMEALLDGQRNLTSHLQLKLIGKRVCIGTHLASHVESRVWSGAFLVGFHPFEMDLEQKIIKAIGDLADNVSIMTEAASFGTNLLAGPVDLLYGHFVVNPETQFAGGGLDVEKATEMMKKFQDG